MKPKIDEEFQTLMSPLLPAELADSTQKERLIDATYQYLIDARRIDERETLPPDALDWYDAVLKGVNDITIIAGAMELELSIRRGEIIKAEGELRGGDQSKSVVNFARVEKVRRSQDRKLANNQEVVRTYIGGCILAKEVPSKRGALTAISQAKVPKPEWFGNVTSVIQGKNADLIAAAARLFAFLMGTSYWMLPTERVSSGIRPTPAVLNYSVPI